MYKVRVDGRVFEISNTEERKNEIVEILKLIYPESKITVEKTGAAKPGRKVVA